MLLLSRFKYERLSLLGKLDLRSLVGEDEFLLTYQEENPFPEAQGGGGSQEKGNFDFSLLSN